MILLYGEKLGISTEVQQKEEGKTFCDTVIASSGEATDEGVYGYEIASSEACSSVDRCPVRYSVRQKDSHRLLFTRA